MWAVFNLPSGAQDEGVKTKKENTMRTEVGTLSSAIAVGAVISVLLSCATLQKPVDVPSGQSVVSITASSFEFEPNHLQVPAATTLVLQVENVSGSDHNITIEDPTGNVLQRVELQAGGKESVAVDLDTSGLYRFYCDKPFHPTMGMKGVIEVN